MTIEFETTIILLSVLCVLRYNSTFSILLNNCLILNDFLTILLGLVPTLLYWLSFCLWQHLYNAQDVIIQLILRLE